MVSEVEFPRLKHDRCRQLFEGKMNWNWLKMDQLMPFMWEAYLDESRTHDVENGGGDVYTVACLIAPSFVWDLFSAAWSEALKSSGAEGKILHMKDVVQSPKGSVWEGWTEAQRKPLFQSLMGVLRSFVVFGYCGSIPMNDYNEVYAAADEEDGPITPYQLILQGTLEAFMKSAETAPKLIRPSRENPVVVLMEQNQLLEASITHQFFNLTYSRDDWAEVFPTIIPIEKGPEPLQAADMVAWEGSTYASRHSVGTSTRPVRALYRSLEQLPQFTFSTAPKELLRDHMDTLINLRPTLTEEQVDAINARYETARQAMQELRDPRYKQSK